MNNNNVNNNNYVRLGVSFWFCKKSEAETPNYVNNSEGGFDIKAVSEAYQSEQRKIESYEKNKL